MPKMKYYETQIFMMCPINEITQVSALTEKEAVKKFQALCKTPDKLDTDCHHKNVFYSNFGVHEIPVHYVNEDVFEGDDNG